MPHIQLSLEALKDLDQGQVVKAFSVALQRAGMDCIDHPGIKAARLVTLQAKMIPVLQDDGDCSEVRVEFTVHQVSPKRTSKPYSLGVNRKGNVWFNQDSPMDIQQTTIFDNEPKE